MIRNDGWIIESRHLRGGVWVPAGRHERHADWTQADDRPQKQVASHCMHVITELLRGETAPVVRDPVPELVQALPEAIFEYEETPPGTTRRQFPGRSSWAGRGRLPEEEP